MDKSIKIKSIILLTSLLVVVFSFSLIIKSNKNENITEIILEGNHHLSQNDYLNFAKIDNKLNYPSLTTRIIKDRLEKHPYISRVDLLLSKNKLTVTIIEKEFESLVMFEEKEYLISENLIIIPRLPNSENIDYPIISNPVNSNTIKEFEIATNNEDLKIGLKIISALKIVSSNLYTNLSEINLRNGKDILLQFSKINAPVILGRNNEIEKLIYLEKLAQKFDYVNINDVVSYIDLRYSNYIYIGKSENSNGMQENII